MKSRDAHRKRLLVVDGSEDLRALYVQLLEAEFDVVAATGGDEAVKMLLQTPFDLLITDLEMKGGHGLDLIQKARKQMPQLPIVVVSAHLDLYRTQLAALKVSLVFSKPFDVARFELGIATLIYGKDTP